MSAPTPGTTSGTAPAGFSVGNNVIEMGSSNHTLNFSNAVKIILTGVTGTIGYRPAGSNTWQTINTQCNSATNHDNISAPGECYFHNGGNTIIWTYHFTSFGGLNTVVSHGSSGGSIRPATPAVPAFPETGIVGCVPGSGDLFDRTSGKSCTVMATPAFPSTGSSAASFH